jgi:hypothetical protein
MPACPRRIEAAFMGVDAPDPTIRTMSMNSRTLAARALLTVLAIAAAPAVGLAQSANCDWYAQTSLKQQQRNEQLKCGFTGPEWSLSRQAHLGWCALQTPDRWKAAAQKREQMLAACKR